MNLNTAALATVAAAFELTVDEVAALVEAYANCDETGAGAALEAEDLEVVEAYNVETIPADVRHFR